MKTFSLLLATTVYSLGALAEGFGKTRGSNLAANLPGTFTWICLGIIVLALVTIIKLVGREEKSQALLNKLFKER